MTVNAYHGHHQRPGACNEGFARLLHVVHGKPCFVDFKAFGANDLKQAATRHSPQNVCLCAPGSQHAVRVKDPGIRGSAFGDQTHFVHEPRFVGARITGPLLCQDIRQQSDSLDIAASPAIFRSRY